MEQTELDTRKEIARHVLEVIDRLVLGDELLVAIIDAIRDREAFSTRVTIREIREIVDHMKALCHEYGVENKISNKENGVTSTSTIHRWIGDQGFEQGDSGRIIMGYPSYLEALEVLRAMNVLKREGKITGDSITENAREIYEWTKAQRLSQ